MNIIANKNKIIIKSMYRNENLYNILKVMGAEGLNMGLIFIDEYYYIRHRFTYIKLQGASIKKIFPDSFWVSKQSSLYERRHTAKLPFFKSLDKIEQELMLDAL